MAIDVSAFDKAHPELGRMSGSFNELRFEDHFLKLMKLEFDQELKSQTARFEAIKHKRRMLRLQRRSLAPRMRARAFRQKQTINQ